MCSSSRVLMKSLSIVWLVCHRFLDMAFGGWMMGVVGLQKRGEPLAAVRPTHQAFAMPYPVKQTTGRDPRPSVSCPMPQRCGEGMTSA